MYKAASKIYKCNNAYSIENDYLWHMLIYNL